MNSSYFLSSPCIFCEWEKGFTWICSFASVYSFLLWILMKLVLHEFVTFHGIESKMGHSNITKDRCRLCFVQVWKVGDWSEEFCFRKFLTFCTILGLKMLRWSPIHLIYMSFKKKNVIIWFMFLGWVPWLEVKWSFPMKGLELRKLSSKFSNWIKKYEIDSWW